jgi:hypothetical protein
MNTTLKLLSLLAIIAVTQVSLADLKPVIPKEVSKNTEIFVERVIVVKGEGVAPADRPLSDSQKGLMAKRAAKVVALRELAEVLQGVQVTGATTVRDAAVSSEEIRVTVDGMVKGAEVIFEEYDKGDEMAVVVVRMPLDGPGGAIESLKPMIVKYEAALPAANVRYTPPAGSVPPPPPPEPVDGLIVDATGTGFKPALVNRILAQSGAVILAPSTIAPEILARRGCGDYTGDVGKAKAILGNHGVRNPLVIKVVGLQGVTDLKVSEQDSLAIFAANKKTRFLEGANVVFVL